MDMKEFVDTHVKLLADGDANKLVEHDYHDGAVMVLMVTDPPSTVVGKEALKGQLGFYLQNIYRGMVSIEKLGITEDSICLEATISTVSGPSKVWDALYMKDGKIFRHYSGLK